MFCFFLEMLCFRIELIGAKRDRIIHRFFTVFTDAYLLFVVKTFSLVNGIIKFGESVTKLSCVNEVFKSLGKSRICGLALCKGGVSFWKCYVSIFDEWQV